MSVAVIGLGNVLLGDDGFGPFVVELLRTRYAFPPEVALLDLGTPGLGLTSYLCGHEAVVIVDSLVGSGIPGDVRVYDGLGLDRMAAVPRVSPHDPAVGEALAIARAAGAGPSEACLLAAVPISLELGTGLSRQMRAAADAASEIARRRVEKLGFAVRRRDTSWIEDDWWLRRLPRTNTSPVRPDVREEVMA
jgi:hydrogenase maturation protease